MRTKTKKKKRIKFIKKKKVKKFLQLFKWNSSRESNYNSQQTIKAIARYLNNFDVYSAIWLKFERCL